MSIRLHGETGSVDPVAIVEGMMVVRKAVAESQLAYALNVDETGRPTTTERLQGALKG